VKFPSHIHGQKEGGGTSGGEARTGSTVGEGTAHYFNGEQVRTGAEEGGANVTGGWVERSSTTQEELREFIRTGRGGERGPPC